MTKIHYERKYTANFKRKCKKIEFRKTFEMVDKSEKQSESPANKMLDHTIGKKFETAPLT